MKMKRCSPKDSAVKSLTTEEKNNLPGAVLCVFCEEIFVPDDNNEGFDEAKQFVLAHQQHGEVLVGAFDEEVFYEFGEITWPSFN